MPRTRADRQKRERQKSFSRIKGRKRKISTSSDEDDEPWNTSLAVHETPSGESEEFLCPYFDGSKLILPRGYDDYKKKVEKDDSKAMTRSKTAAPLRRSTRKSKSKKPMYIYSDDDSSSGFEDSKLSTAIASGTPIPTCMFVNAGVAGGSGIDINKDVFKTLPQTKGLPASAQCGDDDKIEFTIEINESSDDDDSDGTKPKKIILTADEVANLNGINEAKSEVTEPDIKVKDDPIFLSDNEVASNESVKNEKDDEQGDDLLSSNNSPRQEETLEQKTESKDNDEQRSNDSLAPMTDNDTALDGHKNDSSSVSDTGINRNSSINSAMPTCTDFDSKGPSERLNSNDSGNESSTDIREVGGNVQNNFDVNDKNECSNAPSKTVEPCNDQSEEDSSIIPSDKNNEKESTCGDDLKSKEDDLGINGSSPKQTGNSIPELVAAVEKGELVQIGDLPTMDDADENKSEKADSEKTEEMEPEVEHPLISEIKDKMKEYCSQRVEFTDTLDLSGHFAVTADNEKPVRGSIGQSIRKAECAAVETPVPTVCVPQELSNLVQKFCKEKLQYSVELLIQGEIHATIDGILVSTICNFSFEPEEDDF